MTAALPIAAGLKHFALAPRQQYERVCIGLVCTSLEKVPVT